MRAAESNNFKHLSKNYLMENRDFKFDFQTVNVEWVEKHFTGVNNEKVGC